MAKVIDALVVTLGIDASGYKKGAAEAKAAQADLKNSAQAGATATQAAAQKTGKTQKELDKEKRKQEAADKKAANEKARREREANAQEQKSADATIGRLKSVGLAAAGLVLGFSTVKGALDAYLGATNKLANLGRVAPTVGVDVRALDVLGDAYKQVGGSAEEAGGDIAKLAHAQFSFAVNAPDALAGWARRLGVSLFDDKGKNRDKVQIQQDIARALQAQTSDLQTQAAYAREMGLSEAFIQLYLVKNASERAKILKDAEATAKANKQAADAAIAEEQAVSRLKNTLKGKGQQIVGATAPVVAAAANHVADAARTGNWAELAKSSLKGLAYNEVLGFHGYKYAKQFSAAEQRNNLPSGLLARVAHAESNFDPNAKSKSGAVGLMQLMPGTFKGAGKDVNADIDTAGKELGRLLAYYRAKLPEAQALDAALKAYNGGQGNVDNILKGKDPYHNGGKLLPETANYTNRVLQYSGLVNDATTPLAGPGAPKNSLIDRSGGATTTVHIDTINVETQATDAVGVAKDLGPALHAQSTVNQANTGMR
jgi:soluble lytic murein transglycosylase-like protein